MKKVQITAVKQAIYRPYENPHSAMLSCNDGFRPVSFYIETIEENQ